MSVNKTVRVSAERLLELQQELLELSGVLDDASVTALQMAAEIPGGEQLDVPGAKPRSRPLKAP